jgi:hypothetical protein
MSLSIQTALQRGLRRAASPSGIAMFIPMLILQAGIVLSAQTAAVQFVVQNTQATITDVDPGLQLPVSTTVAVGLIIVFTLAATIVVIPAARLLVRDLSELSSIPPTILTRRLLSASLSALVCAVFLTVIIPIGYLLLLVPGVFLTVSFQFTFFAIAVEDKGIIDSLSRSWQLASGERLLLFGMLIVISLLSAVPAVVLSLVPGSTAREIVSLILNSALLVTVYAILADVFVQLRDDEMAAT